jgi:hypothetical protein
VLLSGYVFVNNDDLEKRLKTTDILFVGGDTRYGLGKIRRTEWRELSGNEHVFGKEAHLNGTHPEIQSEVVWGHGALEDSHSETLEPKGVRELFAGWDKDRRQRGTLVWAPGSVMKESVKWKITGFGTWEFAQAG